MLGDKHWYVCLDCRVVLNLEEYEGVEFLRKHWGHRVLEADDHNDQHVLRVMVLGREGE